MIKEQVAAMHEYYELTHEGLYYRLTGLKNRISWHGSSWQRIRAAHCLRS